MLYLSIGQVTIPASTAETSCWYSVFAEETARQRQPDQAGNITSLLYLSLTSLLQPALGEVLPLKFQELSKKTKEVITDQTCVAVFIFHSIVLYATSRAPAFGGLLLWRVTQQQVGPS